MSGKSLENLLRLYNGLDHAVELSGARARLSRRSAVTSAIIEPLHSIAIELVKTQPWTIGSPELSLAWAKVPGLVRFLSKKTLQFEEVSTQQELLVLLYGLASLSIDLSLANPEFAKEKQRQYVVVNSPRMLADKMGIGTIVPQEMVEQISARLSAIAENIGVIAPKETD